MASGGAPEQGERRESKSRRQAHQIALESAMHDGSTGGTPTGDCDDLTMSQMGEGEGKQRGVPGLFVAAVGDVIGRE
jgi:hypothetical protein